MIALAGNSKLKSRKKREQFGYQPICSLFCFYRKFRICFTNSSGYAHTFILSAKDITHLHQGFFIRIWKLFFYLRFFLLFSYDKEYKDSAGKLSQNRAMEEA